MTSAHLDPRRLSAKTARAANLGGDHFLHQRALDDCIDRLQHLRGAVGRLIVVGELGRAEAALLQSVANSVDHLPLQSLEPECADIIVAIGALDHAEDPAIAAFVLRHALRPGGRLIGATIGSGSLARMRRAFLDAERASGRAARRFHPMLDPAALSALLNGAGLSDVVIDVDGFDVRYGGLDHLVRDLRSMGCTNSLAGMVQPLGSDVYRNARDLFSSGAERVEDRFEILHFSGVAQLKV